MVKKLSEEKSDSIESDEKIRRKILEENLQETVQKHGKRNSKKRVNTKLLVNYLKTLLRFC